MTPARRPGWPSSRTSRAADDPAMTTPREPCHVLVVQHQDDCPPALIGEWLVEAGCVLDVRRPYAGEALPDDLAGHDAFLVLGGSMGANDDDTHDWLPPTKELVRDAAQRRTPTLGVCLGHQVAAVALGGEAGRNPRGQQLGLLPMGWTDAAGQDDLTRGLVGTGYGVQWNDDIVPARPGRDRRARPHPAGRAAGGAVRPDGVGSAAPSRGRRTHPRAVGRRGPRSLRRGSAGRRPAQDRRPLRRPGRRVAAARAGFALCL